MTHLFPRAAQQLLHRRFGLKASLKKHLAPMVTVLKETDALN